MKHTPSLHSLRDVSPTPLQGASPLAGETPATAIAGLACSAAFGLFGFLALRVTHSVMGH